MAERLLCFRPGVFRVGKNIIDVDRLAFEHDASGQRSAS